MDGSPRRTARLHCGQASGPIGPRWAALGTTSPPHETRWASPKSSAPERIPARTFAALCDILDCEPNDLFEQYVEMRAAKTADAPNRPEDLGVKPGNPIARPVRLVQDDADG